MRILKILKIALIVMALLAIGILAVDVSISSRTYDRGDTQMQKIQSSPQHKEGRFRNTEAWQQPSFGEYAGTMWEFIFGGSDRTPKAPLPVKRVDMTPFNRPGNDQLNVTWLGHSSLMVNIDGHKVLIDPVFASRLSVLGPSRFNSEVPLDTGRFSEIEVVFISHNHYDHLNKPTIRQLAGKTKTFVVPLGVGAELIGWGVSREKIVELDWWQEFETRTGLKITATPAQHFSGRGLSDRDKTLWVSYVIQGYRHKIFYSGDSGYFEGFKRIGDRYGPFDMTFMECGAYNEKWHHIHMYPEETVQAHLDLRGRVLHPIHWGTFNLSLHPWYEPMERLIRAAEAANVKTALPVVGETTIFGEAAPNRRWWRDAMIHTAKTRPHLKSFPMEDNK